MAASSFRMGSLSSSSIGLSFPSSRTETSSSLQFHVSISSEDNSLDPKTRRPISVISMNAYRQSPRMRIVGFKLPEPATGSSPVPPALLRPPGLCVRGPVGMPIPIDSIEKVMRPPRVRSLLTEALRGPVTYPKPLCLGPLWPQYQGLQICRTWV